MGRVNFGGVVKNVCLDYVPEVEVGDYTIVHVGFAISKIDEETAEQTLADFRALGVLEEELADGDEALARAANGSAISLPRRRLLQAMKCFTEFRNGEIPARRRARSPRSSPARGKSWKSVAARPTPSSKTASTRCSRRPSRWYTVPAARSASRRSNH